MSVSIAKVSASKAKDYYYEKDPLFNENGQGENLEWFGEQAEMLGLKGAISKEEFSNILEGKSPNGATQLREGKATTGQDVAAYDMVFAPPKSVSILAIGGEGDQELIDAHNSAVDKALEYAQKHFSNTRSYEENENGDTVRATTTQGNLLVAKANHSIARSEGGTPDPHLHTHAIIVNQVYDKENDTYKALSAKELFNAQKQMDDIYKSELAKGIVELGYQLESKKHGFDIKMEQSVINTFSSRHNAIQETAAEMGASTYKEVQHIQHSLKSEKKEYSKHDILSSIDKKMTALGTSIESIRDSAKAPMQFDFKNENEVLEKAMTLLSANESVATQRQLLSIASNLAAGQFTYEELQTQLDTVKKIGQTQNNQLKSLGKNEDGEKVFTNLETYKIEKENDQMLQIMSEKQNSVIMSEKQALAGLEDFEKKNFKLLEGQKEAALSILSGDNQAEAIQGFAGSGKTTMLQAVNHALEQQNNATNVTILAPTNKAVIGAIEESKLSSGKSFTGRTTASFVMKNDNSVKGLIIVDESSMLSAKDMNSILKNARETKSKIILIGDTAQLKSISAGNAFENAQKTLKTSELKEVIRQQNDSEKAIAHNARNKQTLHKTFAELERSGKMKEIKSENARIEAIATAAVKRETLLGEKNGKVFSKEVTYKDNVALSSTNEENKKINAAIREKLHASGEINKNDFVRAAVRVNQNMSAQKQTVADNFEKGQTVSTFGDVRGMAKGTDYEIVKINRTKNTLTLKSEDGKFSSVKLSAAAGQLSVSTREEVEFSKGDMVVITNTDKKAGIVNSERGIVTDIDKKNGSITVDFGNDDKRNIDLSGGKAGISHGYSMTAHKSQGISVDRIQINVNTSKAGTDLNTFHVEATRQRLKSEIFTDNIDSLKKQASIEQIKTSIAGIEKDDSLFEKIGDCSKFCVSI
jgi:conjugative relaxase-like TrwC/TraI family protein